MLRAWLVLAVIIGLALWRMATNRDRFRTFKNLVESTERKKFFRKWLIESFIRHVVTGLGALAVIGEWGALTRFPAAFTGLMNWLLQATGLSAEFFHAIGVVIVSAMAAGVVVGAVLPPLVMKLRGNNRLLVVGDISALLPRTPGEYGWTAALSINAGVGEEVMYRLALPLVLFQITGDGAVALLLAAVLFAAAHAYQGWIGLIATFVVGLFLTAIYLLAGSIWPVMLIHALIDLRTLVLMPALMRAFKVPLPQPAVATD